MTDKHGGFAFPQSNPDVGYSDYIGGGMTLRDWFAGQALVACYEHAVKTFANEGWPKNWRDEVAMEACRMADAMLAAREVKP